MSSPNTKRDVPLDYSDLYNTPREALDVLGEIAYLDRSWYYLDPCAGKNVIYDWIKKNVTSTGVSCNEFNDYGFHRDFSEDFLQVDSEWDFDVIIQNPPYKLAKEFIIKGFEVANKQWVFCRLDLLTSKNRYTELFSRKHLKEVHIFSYRVTCTKGVEESPTANAVNYAWYYFDIDFTGDPIIKWI